MYTYQYKCTLHIHSEFVQILTSPNEIHDKRKEITMHSCMFNLNIIIYLKPKTFNPKNKQITPQILKLSV